jgi:RES domain-containing protein
MATATSRQNRALAAALANNLCTRVERFTATDYMVPSTTERARWYLVVADGDDFRCTCAAGQLGQPCQHAAAVYRVRHGLVLSRITVRAAA